jgi:hypothetical protein
MSHVGQHLQPAEGAEVLTWRFRVTSTSVP